MSVVVMMMDALKSLKVKRKANRRVFFLFNANVFTLRGKVFAKIQVILQCSISLYTTTCTPSVNIRIRGQKSFFTIGDIKLIPTPKDPPWIAFSF